jgi:hypothetical protein
MLIYSDSISIQSSFKLNIHSQCLNVDLISPVYITNDGLECYRAPGHRVCAGDAMRPSFILYTSCNKSNGALIYKLQRRQSYESIEISKDTSGAAYLLVVWEISESKKL